VRWFKIGKRSNSADDETNVVDEIEEIEEDNVVDEDDSDEGIEEVLCINEADTNDKDLPEIFEETISDDNADGYEEDIDSDYGSLEPVEESSSSWFTKLRSGLKKSRENIVGQITSIVSLKSKIDDEVWDDIEAVLVQADIGVNTTMRIIDNLRDKVKEDKIQDTSNVIDLLRIELSETLKSNIAEESRVDSNRRKIYLIVGVNGTGKTTTVAKLARSMSTGDKTILLGAADTFRAAATEQLDIWAKRLGVDIIKHERGADPAAVVYDAIHAANARKSDILLIDTAGRLHTYSNLMEELKKIKRIAERERGEADLETFLVIDATTGQNGITQARLFDEALSVDGIVLTKLDGTAKGGIVLAIQEELNIPIRYVGVGEGMDDLRKFDADEFVQALVGEDL
jgi:fused signal recognition particle receptor